MIKKKQSADQKLSVLTNLSLATFEPVALKLRERLYKTLVMRSDQATVFELIEMARAHLKEFAPIYAQIVSDFQLEAWIRGLEVVTSRTPAWVLKSIQSTVGKYQKISQDDIYFVNTLTGDFSKDKTTFVDFPTMRGRVANLVNRGILNKHTFESVSKQIAQRSFTVAYIDSETEMEEIQNLLATSLTNATDMRQFQSDMTEYIDSRALTIPHVQTVFRTNIAKAYGEGREHIMSHPLVGNQFPYASYHAIDDSRVRDDHLELTKRGLDGTNIYRADDPMWSIWTPPCDFDCRCSKSFMTIRQAARKGVKEAQLWYETGEPPFEKEWRLEYLDDLEPNPAYTPIRTSYNTTAW